MMKLHIQLNLHKIMADAFNLHFIIFWYFSKGYKKWLEIVQY